MIASDALHQIDKLLGPRGYLDRPEDLALYEYDGSVDKARPDLVAFPQTAEQVVALVQIAREHRIPIVGRGAGTGLSGGVIARAGGIVISFARMNRDSRNRSGERTRGAGAGRGESRNHAGRGARWIFLRARSVQPESLHHRRQCVGERGRSAHAGVWGDHQSRARHRSRSAGWHADDRGRQSAGSAWLRSYRPAHGFGRHHGAGDQDHRAPDAAAGAGEDAAGDLRHGGRLRGFGGRDHGARHHSGGGRDAGRRDAAHGGRSHARGLSDGCGGGAADRAGRPEGGGGRAGAADRGRLQVLPRAGGSRRHDRRRSASCCGRAARTPSARWAA